MRDTTRISADLLVWGQLRPQYESLSGQQPLFAECDSAVGSANDVRLLADGLRERFDTGKDLPGAEERDQAILWDLG